MSYVLTVLSVLPKLWQAVSGQSAVLVELQAIRTHVATMNTELGEVRDALQALALEVSYLRGKAER